MITKQDLEEAIAECQGQRNPDSSTCIKLAAFYVIRNEMFGSKKEVEQGYSYAPPPTSNLATDGESEFLKAVNGKNVQGVLAIMNELMDTMQVLQPRIYDSVMRKVKGAG